MDIKLIKTKKEKTEFVNSIVELQTDGSAYDLCTIEHEPITLEDIELPAIIIENYNGGNIEAIYIKSSYYSEYFK